MTSIDLIRAAREIWGVGWRDDLVGFLALERTQVWRYVAGRAAIPERVENAVQARLTQCRLEKR